MYIDLANTAYPRRELHPLFLSFIQPRPIGFASTISPAGALNLAPFSFYNMVSTNPPVVVVCPGNTRSGRKKDTLVNIEVTREFVVATVTEPIAERMNVCSTEFAYGVSEFEKSGLTPLPAAKVKAMLVKESPVNIECTLRQIVSFGDGPGNGHAIFGDVVAIHVDEAVLEAGKLLCDPAKLRAVGRMAGNLYSRTTDRFSLESIREPEEFAKRGAARIQPG